MQRISAVNKRLLAVVLVCVLGLSVPGPWSRARVQAAPGGFDVQAFLDRQPGVLKHHKDGSHRAAQAIEGYGTYYSLDARVLLALLELVPHLLSNPNPDQTLIERPFGGAGPAGFTAQIDWVAREVRAGFGPYDKAPEVRFSDGGTATLALDQDASIVAVQRFLAQGRTQPEWTALKDQYVPLFRQLFGAEPETATPTPKPSAGRPFLGLPWPAVYPNVPGDPLSGQPVRMIHSSYFDHVYPTVDRGGRGSDGNDFIVTHENHGNVSYNSHDGHDYYFPDRPIGTPIVAAAGGMAYAFTARGNGVVIRHGGAYAGYESVYWHLDAFDEKFAGMIDTGKGIAVQAGDYLGTSGKSGFVVGGAHLHFEIRHNGKQVDPYGWNGPGEDPCAAWVAGCEASVWLWQDSLRGTYDFTSPEAPAPSDREPPVGTLSVRTEPDLSLLVHFDDHPVQSIGSGAPTINNAGQDRLPYEQGVFGRSVRLGHNAELTYPIVDNLDLQAGALSVWANLPERYPENGTKRHYLLAASSNPGDSARGIYTGTLALRREEGPAGPSWNFWTVDDRGVRHDLVIPDTLEPGWHHFVVNWKRGGQDARGEKQLVIDGIPVAHAFDVALPASAGERLELGRWTAGYGEAGVALDELAIFARPLQAGEARALSQRKDFRTGADGPLAESQAVADREVTLDTNAIDRQGGVVSVRLRRDGEAWGNPVPFYDTYRWSIKGDEGPHTFAVEYRDRADNVSVVTTTVTLAARPQGAVELVEANHLAATLRLISPDGEAAMVRISSSPDFADAAWQPFKEELAWSWQIGRPRIAYVQFQTILGVPGPIIILGDDTKRTFIPLIGSGT